MAVEPPKGSHEVCLQILGVEGVSLTVPNIPLEQTPEKTMHAATKRFARQGAERVTLVPKRDGSGWVKKNE